MANEEHLKILQQGVDVWNARRTIEPLIEPDLSGADLSRANLSQADLRGANLSGADLSGADLHGANLYGADLHGANLFWGNLSGADLSGAHLGGADLYWANLSEANLHRADLPGANLSGADLRRTDLSEAKLGEAALVETNLIGAVLTGCRIYGVSAWNLKLGESTNQQDLVITRSDEPTVVVDNIEVAQFVYLMLHNEKVRDVIDTMGRRSVLLLGRFVQGRIAILEGLRKELRRRGYVPIVLNFDTPETKDFTETVRLLAGLSKFVIADITNPRSAPLELHATMPEIMVPFQPIVEQDEKPFIVLQDLWIKHREWVFNPIRYSSLDALVAALDDEIIRPAEIRSAEFLARKAETMKSGARV